MASFSFFGSLPEDLFRYIFQYFNFETLMELDEVFCKIQQLSAHFATCLTGFVISDDFYPYEKKKYDWISSHRVLVKYLRVSVPTRENLDILKRSRVVLESIHFSNSYGAPCNSDLNSLIEIGNMPLLTFVNIDSCDYLDCDITYRFLKLQPQLEFLRISSMDHLSFELLNVLTSYCPNLKHLILASCEWVTDETIPLLTQGCLKLKSLDVTMTEIQNDATIRLLIASFPSLSALEINHPNLSSEAYLSILREVPLRSILSADSESQVLGLKSLQDNVNITFNDQMMNEVIASNIIAAIVGILSEENTSAEVHTTILQFFYPLRGIEELSLQAQRAIAEAPSALLVDRLQHFLKSDSDLSVLGSCLHLLEYFIRDASTRALVDVEELLTILKALVPESWCPLPALCCFLVAIIRAVPVENHFQELLITSGILSSLLALKLHPEYEDEVIALQSGEVDEDEFSMKYGGGYNDGTSYTDGLWGGIVRIVKQSVQNGDELLVQHLVDSGAFPYLLSKRLLGSSVSKDKVVETARALLDFNQDGEYLKLVEAMELGEEMMRFAWNPNLFSKATLLPLPTPEMVD